MTGYKREEVIGKTPRILQGEKTPGPNLIACVRPPGTASRCRSNW